MSTATFILHSDSPSPLRWSSWTPPQTSRWRSCRWWCSACWRWGPSPCPAGPGTRASWAGWRRRGPRACDFWPKGVMMAFANTQAAGENFNNIRVSPRDSARVLSYCESIGDIRTFAGYLNGWAPSSQVLILTSMSRNCVPPTSPLVEIWWWSELTMLSSASDWWLTPRLQGQAPTC